MQIKIMVDEFRKASLDKVTFLNIHDRNGTPISQISFLELLDFEDEEKIFLHGMECTPGVYTITKSPVFPHHELTGYPKSPPCLFRNYDLFPVKEKE